VPEKYNTIKNSMQIMSVTLLIDDRELPLNEFIENFFQNTISGSLQSLKGVGEWKEVKITIKKD